MFAHLNQDCLFLIYDILPMSTLVRLRCTSRQADRAFAQYIGNRLRITLGRFVTDANHFLQELATTSAVIGGSAAVAVVGRCDWTPPRLDIYVPQAYFAHFIAYLINVEGCEVTFAHLHGALDDQVEALGCNALRILCRSGEHIDVYAIPSLSALQPLAKAWATALLCYVSATSICVAYPYLADLQRNILRPIRLLEDRFPADKLLPLIRKYEGRGLPSRLSGLAWCREHNMELECPGAGSEYCPLTVRYLGDQFTVTAAHLSLLDGRPVPPVTDYLRTLTLAWWEGGIACDEDCIGHGEITRAQGRVVSTVILPSRQHT